MHCHDVAQFDSIFDELRFDTIRCGLAYTKLIGRFLLFCTSELISS